MSPSHHDTRQETTAGPPPSALAAALGSSYRIERVLGRGGMATVYLARDLKHDRDVAIKVFELDVAAAVGADRFLSEIRTTAHLKHPHILPLFDSGSAGSSLFYVMPFIDGESLRSQLRREGRLPIDRVVAVLRELADALAHAHSRGIVHRDVKPDNVLIADRHVFLADFGVARVLAARTVDGTLTGASTMIGTPAYMAPEQLAGGHVDHRADIYALGVLAYELLIGRTPIDGPGRPVTEHRPEIPAPLAALVMRCLEKDPAKRWASTDDLLATLTGMAPVGRRSTGRNRLVPIAAVAVLALAGAALWFALKPQAPADTLVVGQITRVTSEPGLEIDPVVAPDGQTIAYAAGPIGRMRIYVRQISGGRMSPLTDEAVAPAQRWPQWSADGAHLVFQAGPQRLRVSALPGGPGLYRVPALGGVPRRLFGGFSAGRLLGPSWSPNNAEVVFGADDGLYVVAADGEGTPRQIVAGADLHSPRWSKDGRWIAYVRQGGLFTFGEEMLGNVSNSTLLVYATDTGRSVPVTSGAWLDTNPLWLPDGRSLLFISTRGGGRDLYRVRLASTGTPQEEPERITSGLNAHSISLSADGRLLAYASYATSGNIWMADIPRSGVAKMAAARQITFGNEKIEKLALSPDGRWLAYDSDRGGQTDIWKMSAEGGPAEQVTRGPNHKFVNDWSPDGQEILFHSIREGTRRDVLVVSIDGTRTEVAASGPEEDQHAAFGPDGNAIVFDSGNGETETWEAFIVTRAKKGAPWSAPRQLTRHHSSDPKWSPDGRLIAFCADGQLRVVAPDGSGERVIVDAPRDGGPEPTYPVWSPDGRTLFYKAYDRDRHSTIWSVPVTGGTPRLIMDFDDPSRRSLRREFDTDGQRLYFTIARDEADVWVMELKSR